MEINDNGDQLATSLTSGTNFQNLIEDCLFHVFSIKILNLMDLCRIAETCKRFRQIVRSVAPTKIDFAYNTETNDYKVCWRKRTSTYSGKCAERQIQRIAKIFGSTTIDMAIRDFNSPSVYNLILKHHRCDKLEFIKIQHSTVSDIPSGIFTNLKSLQLEEVRIESDGPFARLPSLVDLKLIRVRNSQDILSKYFPKLESFTFAGRVANQHEVFSTESVASYVVFTSFFDRNNTLKSVNLILDDSHEFDMMLILQRIADSCKEVNEFHVNRLYTFFLQPLKSLRSLVCLTLWQISCEDLKVFKYLTTLRTLRLNLCRLPKVSGQFAFLSHITTLDVNANQSFHVIDVVGIIKELVNLEVFNINQRRTLQAMVPFVLDESVFAQIVHLVKERKNILKLNCKTNFVPTNFGDNEKVQLIPLRPNVKY